MLAIYANVYYNIFMEKNCRVFYITDYMEKNKMSKTKFANSIGISVRTLNKILKQKVVSVRFIIPIIRKLNLQPSEFLI